jgi:hypothetical protein
LTPTLTLGSTEGLHPREERAKDWFLPLEIYNLQKENNFGSEKFSTFQSKSVMGAKDYNHI